MNIKKFSKLLKNKKPEQIIEKYMKGFYGDLTERQLEKVIKFKKCDHGGVCFRYKRKKERKMYKCLECGFEFETPMDYFQDNTPGENFEGGQFIETYKGCPNCTSNYDETVYCSQCEDLICRSHAIKVGYKFYCKKCYDDFTYLFEK